MENKALAAEQQRSMQGMASQQAAGAAAAAAAVRAVVPVAAAGDTTDPSVLVGSIQGPPALLAQQQHEARAKTPVRSRSPCHPEWGAWGVGLSALLLAPAGTRSCSGADMM